MNFGENLQTIRKQKNYSQEELAEKLGVSRQAVSKWESGTGFPEAEKLISICDIFNCSMDELIRGKISTTKNSDKKDYDTFMNKFSKSISLSIMLILIGVTLFLAIMGLSQNNKDQYIMYGLVVLLIFVAIATPILILRGIEMDNFKKKHPNLTNLYSSEEIEKYNEKFSKTIAFSISIILIGVVVFIAILSLKIFHEDSTLPVSIFMIFATIAVPIIVNAGILKSKYELEIYNQINSIEINSNDKIGKYCGIIMIIATIIYFIISFIYDLWHISWIVYPIGGMLCGVVSLLFKEEKK